MGVDLRGNDTGVPKKLLHSAQIASTTQEICRKTMPKDMRMDVVKPSDGSVLFDKHPYCDALKRLPSIRNEQAVIRMDFISFHKVGTLILKPSRKCLRRMHADGNDALLRSLSDNRQ